MDEVPTEGAYRIERFRPIHDVFSIDVGKSERMAAYLAEHFNRQVIEVIRFFFLMSKASR